MLKKRRGAGGYLAAGFDGQYIVGILGVADLCWVSEERVGFPRWCISQWMYKQGVCFKEFCRQPDCNKRSAGFEPQLVLYRILSLTALRNASKYFRRKAVSTFCMFQHPYLYPDSLLDPFVDQPGVHPLITVRNNSSKPLRILVEVCSLG